mmetsp:Transcript_3096/g.7924  ORF Transcript_3096/g.7924 Transcript_3096/m.7924 type:complete len:355 (-) Transcript_3096:645-1709(-)
MVVRWSEIEIWNALFSAFRSSPMALRLISVSATSAFNFAIDASMASIVLVKCLCFPSRSSFSCWATLISSSLVSSSLLQNSTFSYSSFCWDFNSSTILSIMTFTLAKSSSFTREARVARAKLLCLRATTATRLHARSRVRCNDVATFEDELTCTKLMVLPKSSRASSSLRIVSASPKAAISSVRTFTRALYSSASVAQLSVMSARNFWLAANAASAAAMSFFAVAVLSKSSARAPSFIFLCFVAAAISPSFAAFRVSNSLSACVSSFCAAARSRPNWSLISERMPKIWPLRELYDFAPAAAPVRPLGSARFWSKAAAPCLERKTSPTRFEPDGMTMFSMEPNTSKRSRCMTSSN